MKYTEGIEKLIRDFCAGMKAQVRTTAELDERILADALPAQNKSKKEQSAAVQPYIWRIIMRNRITKFAAAAVIIFAIIIGIVELGKPVGASIAFATAMDKIRKAGTFSCIQIFEVSYEDDEQQGKYLSKEKLMFKEPDRERCEQLTSPWPRYIGEITITRYDKRQRLILRPVENTAILSDISSDYEIDDNTGELKLTQLDTGLRDWLLDLSKNAVEDFGIIELDGQTVRMLQSHQGKRIATIWIDPETYYPIQIELKWTEENRSPMMYTSIQIDAELDDSLFSLEPPEGYTLSVREPGPDYKRKMMTKMMRLGLWCISFASNNDDQFPEQLADIVTSGIVTEDVLNKTLSAPDVQDGPAVIRYRRPGTVGKNWANEVILYEIYDKWPEDGVVACFTDGHSELIVDQNHFEELIK